MKIAAENQETLALLEEAWRLAGNGHAAFLVCPPTGSPKPLSTLSTLSTAPAPAQMALIEANRARVSGVLHLTHDPPTPTPPPREAPRPPKHAPQR